jgi:hypothetical protein
MYNKSIGHQTSLLQGVYKAIEVRNVNKWDKKNSYWTRDGEPMELGKHCAQFQVSVC